MESDKVARNTRVGQASRKRALSTTSPTDERISPISKILIGSPRHKRTRPQLLRDVIQNDRQKRVRQSLASKLSIEAKLESNEAVTDRLKEKIKKTVLVALSPNIPRPFQGTSRAKTPKEAKTPRNENVTLNTMEEIITQGPGSPS